MIRVDNVNQHHQRAMENGVLIISEPKSHVYGENQYSAKDFIGHVWTFSETLKDTLPEEWGGKSINLK